MKPICMFYFYFCIFKVASNNRFQLRKKYPGSQENIQLPPCISEHIKFVVRVWWRTTWIPHVPGWLMCCESAVDWEEHVPGGFDWKNVIKKPLKMQKWRLVLNPNPRCFVKRNFLLGHLPLTLSVSVWILGHNARGKPQAKAGFYPLFQSIHLLLNVGIQNFFASHPQVLLSI